ncbi:MAG: ATP-dependent sacrificial sulfur transferase LarE [Bacteroidales bacterium]|nr:ATP-dependent sacrificial sulfur transferase LarE [Bacteroidales bacterium]
MREKESLLEQWFRERRKVLVALSGGVDSCLVAYMARKYLGRDYAISVIGVSPSLKTKDYELAVDFCKQNDIKYIEVNPDEINDPNYASNPLNRCYFCKDNLYRSMHALRNVKFPGYLLLNGSNYSDFGDYRPGLKAAEENKAYSPLADCGFTKDEIRLLAKKYKLSVWDKPASPCLSSRFPYGEAITAEKLQMVEKAENLLNAHGFDEVRVRYINSVARIEVPVKLIAALETKFAEIEPDILSIGFFACEIDTEGLVSGKLNWVVNR